MELVGRGAERAAVEHLLAEARAGRSGSLTVLGEAGIGKTALLEHARSVAGRSGFRVESAIGLASETQFAFGALHQLCSPLLDHLDALPEPQQVALRTAFGQQVGAAPDRFLISLAVLNLLSEAAEQRPLLGIVDDAHWLDEASAQVLAFVARRLAAEQLALVLCVRDPTDDGDLSPLVGLPALRLTGLTESDARALLAAAVSSPLDDEVRDRVVAEARGNPLALLELPRSAPATQLFGGFELPDELSVPLRIEEMYRQRSRDLPSETQLLLLLAAADPTGDAAVLWRAAAELGIEPDTAAPAEAAGLLEIDTRVRFRHPLVRSAVYRACSEPDRRRVHGALAAATDSHSDPDRRAWHRARAVLGTDEEAAAELESSAGRARARGGLAAAAAFLQQAVELTPDPAQRALRALDAAHAKHEAGAFEAALELLTLAAAGPLDALRRARVALLRAQIAFYLARDSDVPGMLLDAAAALAPLDPALSRETYLQAVDTAIIIGGLGDGRGARDVAEAARAAPAPPGPPTPVDLLLDAIATVLTRGTVAGAPALHRALAAFRAHDPYAEDAPPEDLRRWLPLASSIALVVYDDESLFVLTDRTVRLAREAGAMATLYAVLLLQVATLQLGGRLAEAAELAAEQDAITRVIGALPLRHARILVAAWRGDENESAALYAASVPETGDRRHGHATEASSARLAQAVLQNSLGNYPAALAAAERAVEVDELWYAGHALPEIVEAASRTEQPARAAAALEQLSARATASGTAWALGVAARCRALTSADSDAEGHYREAVELLGHCRIAVDLARAHLVYGEWLRRQGRRQDARDQLRTAHELLSDMGAKAFAARAARELRATGEHPRKRSAQPTDALTAHELQIARLVATGATSREVAAQLFLSPRTIEAHLRNIFRKVGITSRRQLRDLRLS